MPLLLLAAALAANITATVRIEVRDYSLTLPAHVHAGRTAFTLDNRGAEPHEVRFLRLAAPHAVDDFVAWQKSGQPIPEWLEPAGGIGSVAPGLTVDYVATLTAGPYVVLCGDSSPDGTSHLAKGMFAAVQVDPDGASAPAPDAEAWFSAELTPGRYLLMCAVIEDAGRHYDLGMIYRFVIQ